LVVFEVSSPFKPQSNSENVRVNGMWQHVLKTLMFLSDKGRETKSALSTLWRSDDFHECRCQLHQRFTNSFYVRRSQKKQNDSQVMSHFALLGSTRVKAAHKHVG